MCNRTRADVCVNQIAFVKRLNRHGAGRRRNLCSGGKTFVGYDRLERPAVAVVLDQPGQLLVVGRVNVGGRHQGCQTLFDIARHRHDPQVLGVVPLRHLVRPRRLSHAQGGQHQHRVHVLDAGQVLQRRQHGDRLAAAHWHPQGATGLLVDVVYGVVLVRVGDEGAAHACFRRGGLRTYMTSRCWAQ